MNLPAGQSLLTAGQPYGQRIKMKYQKNTKNKARLQILVEKDVLEKLKQKAAEQNRSLGSFLADRFKRMVK